MRLLLSLLLIAGFMSTANAQGIVLEVGDTAPVFEAPSDDGTTWRSEDHVGDGYLVVYFYPAAMTGGCTDQACTYRDNRSRLQELGATVVGISGDRVENLRIFKRANQLNFTLLSDSPGEIAHAFGVPVRDGATISAEDGGQSVELTRDVTTARWTFIIAPDGTIAYKAQDVSPSGDGEAVIQWIVHNG